jgi:hypothetical protein
MQEVKMLSFRKIRIITWKDILEVKQNKSVVLSLALVPLLIMVVMPMVMLLVSSSSGSADAFKDPDLQMMFERMPAAISDELEGMNDVQLTMAMILGYLFAPMFLILPLLPTHQSKVLAFHDP